MGSLPFSNHNLTQIFFALLPDKGTGQNIGKREKLTEIQDLLKFGVDINAEIHPGYTPICKAIEGGGSKSLVELLLNAGAKIGGIAKEFEWRDVDGKIIKSQPFALARQRVIKEKDHESLEIQELIQKRLMQQQAEEGTGSSRPLGQEGEWQGNALELGNFIANSASSHPAKLEALIKKKIYIFDFDNCIVNGNFHNILKNMGVSNGRASPDLVDFLFERYGIKNRELLLCAFKDILKNEDCISIASFSRYPETVFAALKKLGLTDEERSQIYYEPPDLETVPDLTQGKNVDILRAMVHFEVIDINAVYLIDHDKTNLQIAKSRLNIPEGHLIKVESGNEPFPAHLQVLQKTMRHGALNEEDEDKVSYGVSEDIGNDDAKLNIDNEDSTTVLTTNNYEFDNKMTMDKRNLNLNFNLNIVPLKDPIS